MKTLLLLLIFLSCSIKMVVAQNTEEETLKKIVRAETESFMKRDSAAWKALFVHDEKMTRIYSGNGFYYNSIGWKNFGPEMLKWMKEGPKPSRYTAIQNSNYTISLSDNLAWMAFDQIISAPENDTLPSSFTREMRTLVKDNNQWKISSIITIDTLSYATIQPNYVENLFNATGYNFLNEKKINEAIEIFKLNVKLYPKAWNTHDSLGEAYAAAGDKKNAIACYEKSIALNPQNENGKTVLAKLKAK